MDEIVRKLRDKRHKLLFESVEEEYSGEDLSESYYYVSYAYDGDSQSPYKSTVIVKSDSEQSAIMKAKRLVKDPGARNFSIDRNMSFGRNGKFDSIEDYRKKFPHSNFRVLEDQDMETEEEGQLATEGDFEEFKESATVSLGHKFRYIGFDWEVIATKGEYFVGYASKKRTYPYVVAKNPSGRELEDAHTFESKERARNLLLRKSGTLKESENASTVKKCTCGSTNVVNENGQDICDDCGRQVKSAPIKEATPNDTQKMAALRKAVEWWTIGKYQRAVELYKRYGITDAEFARALVGSLRESEEEVNLDADDIDESLTMSPATSYIEKDGEESLRVIINDTEYRYRSETMSVNDLLKKFMGIYKHSAGSALQWLKRNSYVYYNGKTKKLAESEQVAFITPGISPTEDVLGKNIIRSVHTPMSTSAKPGFDASISEANDLEKTYTERELIAHLRNSKDSTVYVRTTRVQAGWDDVQFAAQRAGYEVSRVNDKSLLQKLKLPGNFAEFYVFRKR